MKTALVSCSGVPGMYTRMDRPVIKRDSRRVDMPALGFHMKGQLADSRPRLLPLGFWDIWRPGTTLCSTAPQVFAAPLAAAGRQKVLEAMSLVRLDARDCLVKTAAATCDS